ncbi:MAG: metalloregulator ArsR/SmtB family transcription factor, partial [Candidatus Nanohaloarchaea archaeon]|nr:metalloregulator ArsR/SmtB family transcription factor [Candidatus Nanohaloarchaea archaeon]
GSMLEDQYDTFFNTLANRKRLRILDYLKEHDEANVTTISDSLSLNQSTVSQNLLRLESCGFVEREKDGKQRIYRINEDTIGPLMEIIDEHVENYCSNLCDSCED